MIIKVLSGGQTGVDKIGLEVARAMKIETGGTAPKNWITENGPDSTLKDFGLVESNFIGYLPRTQQNVLNSDGTVLYGDMTSSGSKITIDFLKNARKPYVINPTIQQFVDFIINNDIKVLNVAGNRESVLGTNKSLEIRGLFLSSIMKLKDHFNQL